MEERQATLRAMKICRFCLTEKDPLTNIYERDNKNAIPLPLQIMACVAIEAFANDGMPQLICDDCRIQTGKSYSFKTMCKKSDDALKLFLATGVLRKSDDNKEKNDQKKSVSSDIQAPAPKRLKPNHTISITEIVTENVAPEIETHTKSPEIEIDPLQVANEEIVLEQRETDSDKIESQKQISTHCFSCSHCERSFPLQQLLDIHMRQHTRERKFPCYECGKKFFSKHDLSKHIQIHSGEKPYTCVICEKSFSRPTLLHRHEKIHVTVPKYLCTYCDRTYLTSEDLDAHLALHKKKRPFKCSQCDKSFAFKQGLERHEAIHSTTNLYKCDYCEESFGTPGKLARHVTGHAGTRPYPCKLCPRTFLLSHHLTRHLRNHYNKKAMDNEYGDFKCDVCSMSFRRKDSLINHTAIHSMVNLKCVICNKEFGDAKTVKEHVSTHLSGLPYPCDKCDYSFETQEELEDHEVKHVDDDEDCEEDENDYILEDKSLVVVRSVQENDSQDKKEGELPRRRSQRETKIKNYAEFLKDELGSDSEEEEVDEPEEVQQPEPPKVQIGTIQPVIRSEAIKTYKGVKEKTDKNTTVEPKPNIETPKEVKVSKPELPKTETPKSLTKITTLENLGISKQTLDAMTEKSGYVEMKVGQKVIRVQKLMMSKAEYQAISKKTKLEVKGSTVVVNNLEGGLDLKKLTQLTRGVANDPLTETASKFSENKVEIAPDVDIQVNKTPLRTYVKKTVTNVKKKVEPQENQTNEEVKSDTAIEGNIIDLTNATSESSTISETDMMEIL